MFEPTNEQGVVAVFCSQLHKSGWEIVAIGAAFPDAILKKNSEEWRVEFEYRASNFVQHNHDFRQCDLIICWENDLPDCLIPVLELSDTSWIDADFEKPQPLLSQIEYWRRRALRAELILGREFAKKTLDDSMDPEPNKTESRRQTLLKMLEEIDGQGIDALNKSALAKRLDVSRPTLNTDLAALESVGKLTLNGHVKINNGA